MYFSIHTSFQTIIKKKTVHFDRSTLLLVIMCTFFVAVETFKNYCAEPRKRIEYTLEI